VLAASLARHLGVNRRQEPQHEKARKSADRELGMRTELKTTWIEFD
jgi:hypothetical protein